MQSDLNTAHKLCLDIPTVNTQNGSNVTSSTSNCKRPSTRGRIACVGMKLKYEFLYIFFHEIFVLHLLSIHFDVWYFNNDILYNLHTLYSRPISTQLNTFGTNLGVGCPKTKIYSQHRGDIKSESSIIGLKSLLLISGLLF